MEELELVFEVLECGPDAVEAPGLINGSLAIPVLVGRKILDEDEAGGGFGIEGFDGIEEMGSGDVEDGVTQLVVKIPDLLQQCLDLLHLHMPHREEEQQEQLALGFLPIRWKRRPRVSRFDLFFFFFFFFIVGEEEKRKSGIQTVGERERERGRRYWRDRRG